MCAAAGSAGAQDAPGVEQIGAQEAGQPVETPQVSSERRTIDLPLRAPRQSAPPTQLSRPDESAPATPQLTRTSESPRAAPQLYRGGRTAQPAAPLSTPREGRTGAVEIVQGEDRCDPGERRRPAPDCARVIETRAAEFRPPAPAKLSPEQRLLGEQRTPAASTAEAAARRLATNVADPNSMEDQSIAAIVLRDRPATPAAPVEEEPAEEASPAIQAIVGAITGDPRR